MNLPDITTPEALAEHLGWPVRRVRRIAKELGAWTALIRQTKVNDERKAHLPAALAVKLANLDRVPGRGVFGYKHPDDIWRVWEAAIKRAGIKHLSPHCCRHGFATGLLRRGVDVVTVAKLGGWRTAALVLSTYGHAIKDAALTDVLMTQETKTSLQVIGKTETN